MNIRRVAHLKPVPHDQRLSARDQARNAIKQELASLKPGSKEVITSNRLLAALEAAQAEMQGSPVTLAAAAKTLKERLGRLKNVKGALGACQKRDLKIILFFTSGDRWTSVRQEACAILKLYGDDMSIAEVCQVYPGLRKAFEE